MAGLQCRARGWGVVWRKSGCAVESPEQRVTRSALCSKKIASRTVCTEERRVGRPGRRGDTQSGRKRA